MGIFSKGFIAQLKVIGARRVQDEVGNTNVGAEWDAFDPFRLKA